MKILLWTFLLFFLTLSVSSGETIEAGRFSKGDLEGWEVKKYEGKTEYSVVDIDNKKALRSKSSSAASGLIRKMKVNLEKTPFINWSWRIENVLEGVDERTKDGDDYPARVYVIFSGGVQLWKTKAVNYVWSNNQPTGTEWPSAYTKNNMKIAVRAGKQELGVWLSEKRNITEDYERLFGEKPPGELDAVAVMTDTDNSGKAATAYFGDIFFTSE